MTGGIKLPITAAFDQGQVDREMGEFEAKLNRMGEAVARAGKVKFQPFDKTTLDEIRRVQAAAASLTKLSGDFAKRRRATGQESTSFVDLDYGKMYPDPHARARQMRKHFEYVTGGSNLAPVGPPPGAPAGAPPPPPPGRPQAPAAAPPPGGPPSNTGRVLRAGLNATGLGGPVSTGMADGAKFGVGAGVAGFIGGIAALTVGKAISAVMAKIGAAQQESIGYDTLKRNLGDVNVSFGVLKDSLRETARGLDMTFDESLKLGSQFTKLSGLTGDGKSLGEEVNTSGGFARSYGLDPAESTAFMAQMRLNKVTSNVDDSRRTALMISEAIGKSGAFSKVDEVLQAISGFASMQTRNGLSAANVSGYTGMLSGLMGSGIAGLDPASAGALLNRANSTIAGGGGAGEAGQNFLYSSLGSTLGLNPIQAAMLREQGLFGTGKGTFGKGSLYERYAGQNGLEIPDAANSETTNLELIMEKIRQTSSGNKMLDLNRLGNLMGVNTNQAMALSSIDPKHLGALAGRLSKAGVDLKDVNYTGLSKMGQIEGNSSLSEDQKNAMVAQAAKDGQEKTEGSETRRTIAGVERAVQAAASLTIPVLNGIRDAVMFMAGEKNGGSPRQIQEAIASREAKDRMDTISSEKGTDISDAERSATDARNRHLEAAADFNRTVASKTPEERAVAQQHLVELKRVEVEAQERVGKLKEELAGLLQDEVRRKEQAIRAIRSGPGPTEAQYDGYSKMVEDENHRRFTGRGNAVIDSVGQAPGSVASRNMPAGSSNDYDQYFAEAGKKYGVDPALLKTIAQHESRLRPGVISEEPNRDGTHDFGIMQHNGKYLAERGLDGDKWKDPRENIMAGAKLLSEKISKTGSVYAGVKAYNGSGPNAERYAMGRMKEYNALATVNSETGNTRMVDTSDLLSSRMAGLKAPETVLNGAFVGPPVPDSTGVDGTGTPLPIIKDEMGANRDAKVQVQISGDFNLRGANGMPAAAPAPINATVSVPRPSGSRML